MDQKHAVVHSDPEILGGTPVFAGTRVPVQSLFDYLEGAETLDAFLRQFPSVRREQAVAALELARESLLAGARPADLLIEADHLLASRPRTACPSRRHRG